MVKQILHLRTSAFGFQTVIAKVRISKLAEEVRGDYQYTDLVCPKCNQLPGKEGREIYKCSCGFEASSWQKLKRLIKGTFKEVVKARLESGDKETYADMYKMRLEEFARFVDATKEEHGVLVDDEPSARNLFKLLVGAKFPIAGQKWVIIIFWKDTYEERIALLTTSISGTIILKEIIPRNLALLRETLRVDEKNVSEQDMEQAKALLMQVPEAKEEMFDVKDYRKEIAEQFLKEEEYGQNIQDLNAILEKGKKKLALAKNLVQTESGTVEALKVEVKAQAETRTRKKKQPR